MVLGMRLLCAMFLRKAEPSSCSLSLYTGRGGGRGCQRLPFIVTPCPYLKKTPLCLAWTASLPLSLAVLWTRSPGP